MKTLFYVSSIEDNPAFQTDFTVKEEKISEWMIITLAAKSQEKVPPYFGLTATLNIYTKN